jgi:hypothetical protein
VTAPLLADLSPQQAASAAVAAAAGGPTAGGPLANDPAVRSADSAVSNVFSVSSVLHDSTFSSSDDRSRMTVN